MMFLSRQRWKTIVLPLVVSLTTMLLALSIVWAGNKWMIESEVQKLDRMNKQAVEEIPDLPRDGRIELKAKAVPRGEGFQFDIEAYGVEPIEHQTIRSDSDRETIILQDKRAVNDDSTSR